MEILHGSFGPVETNSYLILDPQSLLAVWIDPSAGSRALLDQLPPSYSLQSILLTHSHWDHICDIGHCPQANSCSVYVHSLDSGNVKSPGSDGLKWPQSIPKPLDCTIQTLKEGDTWTLGNNLFTVLHTPGHSPGSCCFYCQRDNLLISGDTLFAFGYGRVDLPGSEPATMLASLKRLSQLSPDTKILAGHGQRGLLKEMSWLTLMLTQSP